MLEIWDKHGPPSFVTLAAAHLDPKKRKKRKTSNTAAPATDTGNEEKETGTMADLAARFGLGGKKKKVAI